MDTSIMYQIREVLAAAFPEQCESKLDWHKDSDTLSFTIGDCTINIIKNTTGGFF